MRTGELFIHACTPTPVLNFINSTKGPGCEPRSQDLLSSLYAEHPSDILQPRRHSVCIVVIYLYCFFLVCHLNFSDHSPPVMMTMQYQYSVSPQSTIVLFGGLVHVSGRLKRYINTVTPGKWEFQTVKVGVLPVRQCSSVRDLTGLDQILYTVQWFVTKVCEPVRGTESSVAL